MVSYIAVVFFCLAQDDCYFWSSKKLHAQEASCQREIAALVKETDKAKIPAAYQCIKVPLTEA